MNKSVLLLSFALFLASPASAVPPADPGSALQFDGSGQIALVPYAPGLEFNNASTWTLEFWVLRDDDGGVRHLMGRRGNCGNTSDMVFQIFGDASGYNMRWDPGTPLSLGVLPLGQWTHRAVVCDGQFLRSYANGSFLDQTPVTANPQNTTPLSIGGVEVCPFTFGGMIDEVRVWSTARTAGQISYWYDCVVDPDASPGLVANWSLDAPACSQVILDLTPNCHHGVLGSSIAIEGNDAVRVASTVPMACALVSVDPAPAPSRSAVAISLGAAHPNPATSRTAIELEIRSPANVEIAVYDVAGDLVRGLREGRFEIGRHVVPWDGLDDRGQSVVPGVYFIRARSGSDSWTRPVTLLR
jgi:hypothetical protein